MRQVRITVAAGLGLTALMLAVTLSGSPIAVAGRNLSPKGIILTSTHRTAACQSGEALPQGITAVRLFVSSSIGPRVDVRILERGRVIAHGETGSGWTGGVVTVPLNHETAALRDAELCFDFHLNGDETLSFAGRLAKGRLAARTRSGHLPGRVAVEYLSPSRSSWWSLIGQTSRRMGLGRAGAGTWSVLLVIALMASAVLVTTRVLTQGSA